MKSMRSLFLFAAAALLLAACHQPKLTGTHLINLDPAGLAIDGYDPVAFFTQKMPVKGQPNLSLKHNEATYFFATEANRKLFMDSPAKYEPQFGGYCAYAVSLGTTAPVDVNLWAIQDGRLIFQHNQKAVAGWNKDAPGNLSKADKYWPQIVSRAGKPVIPDDQKDFLNNLNAANYAIDGYDPVAYFTQNKAVKGLESITKLYNGAFYCFATEEDKQLFGANPEKYAPQYGAFCAYAVSIGKLRPINPEIFQIVDGRLMLQHSQDALQKFSKDLNGNAKKADANWPGIVQKRKGKKVKFDEPAK